MSEAKARILENKGDQFQDKGKMQKAFDHYQKALELDPQRIELYDKLIDLHKLYVDDWTEDDFAYNVYLTMQKQEVLDPTFKRLHAQHEPEYKDVSKLIRKLLDAKTSKTETKYVEAIKEYGDHAIYPLIDILLGFKQVTQGKAKKKSKKK